MRRAVLRLRRQARHGEHGALPGSQGADGQRLRGVRPRNARREGFRPDGALVQAPLRRDKGLHRPLPRRHALLQELHAGLHGGPQQRVPVRPARRHTPRPGRAGLADVRALARLLPPVRAFDIERVHEDPLRERGRDARPGKHRPHRLRARHRRALLSRDAESPEGRLGVPAGRDFLLRRRRGAGVAQRLAGNPRRHGVRGRRAERLGQIDPREPRRPLLGRRFGPGSRRRRRRPRDGPG